MSVSSLRWRAVSALIAAGAAAAVIAPAVPAGASTGTAEISPEQAGYAATGAQFQSAGAEVYLRQPGQYAGQVASYARSVQPWWSGLQSGADWVAVPADLTHGGASFQTWFAPQSAQDRAQPALP
jgi:hypothetical protein